MKFKWGERMITIEGFRINLIVAILLVSILVCIYKYLKIKDKELRINILNNVYAPLYMLIARQEIYRKILDQNSDVEEYPIFEYINSKQESMFSQKEVINDVTQSKPISRKSFIEELNKVDVGLASHRLVTLLSMYKGAVELEESLDSESENEKKFYLRATVARCDIEKDLLKEIVDGYVHIYNKLKLYDPSYKDKWHINTKNCMVIDYNLQEDRM